MADETEDGEILAIELARMIEAEFGREGTEEWRREIAKAYVGIALVNETVIDLSLMMVKGNPDILETPEWNSFRKKISLTLETITRHLLTLSGEKGGDDDEPAD